MVEIRCEDDLWRHYARDPFWLKSYIMEDNSTCISPPDATGGFHAPGYGGAYAGSKVRCAAAHDLRGGRAAGRVQAKGERAAAAAGHLDGGF